MKIAALAVAATAFLHLKGPDGNLLFEGGQKVGITLFGPGSPEAERVDDRQSTRMFKRYEENDKKLGMVPAEKRRFEAAEDLVGVTAEFHHIEYDGPDGTPLAGVALYTAVYSDPSLGWIRDQATKFLGDWGKFAPGLATS